VRSTCKECGGSQICDHGRVRSTCKECGGSQICEHGRRRSKCKECGGASICEHNRERSTCKECGGSGICEHGRVRSRCKECGGASICEHGRQRSHCKDCGGSGICEHGRRRHNCKDCGGSGICEHGRDRSYCLECPRIIVPRTICSICREKTLSGRRLTLGKCAECESTTPERIEITFGNMIIEAFGYEPNARDKTMASGSACNGLQNRRPDLIWVYPGKVAVVVEIDEDSHSSRESSCELRKISEQNEAIQLLEGCECIPVYTIRVNPDAYDGGNVIKKERAEKVAGLLGDILHGEREYEQNGYMKVIFCYYHSKSRHHIDAHKAEFDCEEL